MEYVLIRSERRTISLEVKPDLRVILRTPVGMPQKEIEKFLARHQQWLSEALERTKQRNIRDDALQLREAELRTQARQYLPQRTAHWAEIMGVCPAGVRISSAKTRFGSCSGSNRICYSWRLMAYPTEAIDYVIVHELAHILQKNHSSRFYAVVQRVLPDWKSRRALLKK